MNEPQTATLDIVNDKEQFDEAYDPASVSTFFFSGWQMLTMCTLAVSWMYSPFARLLGLAS